MTTIRTIPETGSTNADLIALAATGIPEGFWLRAERQTGGRGRLARRWESPAGNLYCSTIVRLRPYDPPPGTLALVAAVAVQEIVGHFLPPPHLATIKWPNDILIGNAKLCGMLLERAADAIIIGVGLNVAHHPDLPDRPATSLAACGAGAIDPGYVLETLAESFARWLEIWRAQGIAPVRERWLKHAHPSGTALRANLPDGSTLEGLFVGLDSEGALILCLANGGSHVIHAGDVFLV